jgi:Domain of unknown function (DUF5103)
MRHRPNNLLLLNFFILFAWGLSSNGQTVNPNQNNTTYLKTVLLQRSDLELSLPIIKLNSNDQLILRFDDLRSGVHDFSYTIQHCNYDWSPSGLLTMDFLNGFETQFISDYAFSFNTRQGYTQYTSTFPNNDFELLVSGNYLLYINESGIDSPVLVIPFYVWEDMAGIDAQVVRPNLSALREDYQRLIINADIEELPTSNPYDEVRLVIMQNYRYDNALYEIKPRLISNNSMVFDQNDLVFAGMKEYRRFDTRSLRIQSERIIKIERDVNGYNAYINIDENRSYKRYSFENDINGRFLIDADLTNDSHLQSDYAMVHFTLESPYWMSNGDYYVMGTFSNYLPTAENKMEYDADKQVYTASIYLKQGYYNYQYAFIDNKSGVSDYSMAEGNYFESMNDYSIFLYVRDNMRNADRLTGYATITSFPR